MCNICSNFACKLMSRFYSHHNKNLRSTISWMTSFPQSSPKFRQQFVPHTVIVLHHTRISPTDAPGQQIFSSRRCPDNSYRYRLVTPEGCNVAHCAGEFASCESGEIWDPESEACISMWYFMQMFPET